MRFVLHKEIESFLTELEAGLLTSEEVEIALMELEETLNYYKNELKNAKDSMFQTYAEIKVKELQHFKEQLNSYLDSHQDVEKKDVNYFELTEKDVNFILYLVENHIKDLNNLIILTNNRNWDSGELLKELKHFKKLKMKLKVS
jgi:hypothetical protein